MDIQKLILSPEYDFLRKLDRPLLFLTLGGSRAYGTSIPGSDIDLRGCAMQKPAELLGLKTFEAFADRNTDTTIYGSNYFISKLSNCVPNVIEMLGNKEDQYLFLDPCAQMLLQNKAVFLSQKAGYSFGGYANSQLRQLRTFLSTKDPTQQEKETQLFRTATHMMEGIQYRYPNIPNGTVTLYLEKSENPDREIEVYADIEAKHVPLRTFNGICNELGNVCGTYEKIGKRNTKKDEKHLNKHIMHLCRYYLMCFDILEKEQIVTYREADRDFLLEVRNGKFLRNGALTEEFEELLVQYEKRLAYDRKNTSLPELPDYDKIEELMMEINKKAVNN